MEQASASSLWPDDDRPAKRVVPCSRFALPASPARTTLSVHMWCRPRLALAGSSMQGGAGDRAEQENEHQGKQASKTGAEIVRWEVAAEEEQGGEAARSMEGGGGGTRCRGERRLQLQASVEAALQAGPGGPAVCRAAAPPQHAGVIAPCRAEAGTFGAGPGRPVGP